MRLKQKIRTKVRGTSTMPRLSVFRSNSFIYAQIIDDTKGVTIASSSDIKMKGGTKTERAVKVGKEVADMALGKKIEKVVFDRNGFKYAGRVSAVANGAREAGLKF